MLKRQVHDLVAMTRDRAHLSHAQIACCSLQVVFWKLRRAKHRLWSAWWTGALERGLAKHTFSLVDQDLFNFAASEHPEVLTIVPWSWNVQLARHICTENKLSAEENRQSNRIRAITVLHGNNKFFRRDHILSNYVWFPFVNSANDTFHEAQAAYKTETPDVCKARQNAPAIMMEHLDHCKWDH